MRTSRAQANRLRAIQLRMFHAGERTVSRRVSPVMSSMLRAAAFAAERGNSIDAAVDRHTPSMRRVLRSTYAPIQEQFADLSRSMIGLKSEIPVEVKQAETLFERELLLYAEEQSLAAATSISASSKALVSRIISNGEAAGESVRTIATEIRKATGLSPFRAARVARTETHSAAMHASQTFAKSTDLELIKIWLTTTDDVTRDTHITADLQERELDDSYDVGGASLRFPGDPGGPVEEIVNCRCGELYEEPEDA